MINEISKLNNKNVLVIGDIILDHYINIIPNKISQEAPILVFNLGSEYNSLGGCANVCKYLSSFNINVDIIGVIGKDNNSKIVKKLLNDSHINMDYLIEKDNIKTTTKNRFFSEDNKQVLRVDDEENNIEYTDEVLKILNKNNKEYDLIIISDYKKGVISEKVFNEIINKYNHTKIICDPKNNKYYKDMFLLKPNKKELEYIIGNINDNNIIEYKNENNIDNLLLTLGKDGMKLYDKDNNIHTINSINNTVYDVTGAGDCVLSYLSLGILLNLDLIDSCKLSNYAASKKVSKFGTQLVSLEEVIDYFNDKLIDRNNIGIFFKILHNNKTIVFTNGCYDIIHSGHIHLLKEAKKLGDILVLGLNSDDSIKRLKGNNRPILNEKERINILKSIEYIDYIVVFDEDTPLNIIKEIKPDYLVKGSDYKDKKVVGSDFVIKNGGALVLIDLVEGKSTTNIINKIKEINNE